jgi:hypothetical protein
VLSEDEEEKEAPLEYSIDEQAEPASSAAAAAASSAATSSISEMQDKWRLPESKYSLIERKCLAEIQAPSGILSSTKLPFTRTGEMTAHHWVNFAKVYGSYLFVQHYSNHSLILLCDILRLLQLCLSSVITPELVKDMKNTARDVANWFDKLLPGTEKAIIFHLLVFHIPGTLEQWGPARNFWCFPFERSVVSLLHFVTIRYESLRMQLLILCPYCECAVFCCLV